MSSSVFETSVTFALNASLSSEVDLRKAVDKDGKGIPDLNRVFALDMPASWTTATIALEKWSEVQNAWLPVTDAAGAEITFTVGAGKAVLLDPVKMSALVKFRLRSGTSAAPVAQTGARTIGLTVRTI